jgi:paraquat-inducible protein A
VPVHTRIHLYEAVEFIGRWSMVDVFVVAILTALIQMGFFAAIEPGPAAVFFALSVAFTMISAQAMDPRLIWDSVDHETPKNDARA